MVCVGSDYKRVTRMGEQLRQTAGVIAKLAAVRIAACLWPPMGELRSLQARCWINANHSSEP
jgi:hypothetical protein